MMRKIIYLLLIVFMGALLGGPLMARPKKKHRTKSKTHAVVRKKATKKKVRVKQVFQPVYDIEGNEIDAMNMFTGVFTL